MLYFLFFILTVLNSLTSTYWIPVWTCNKNPKYKFKVIVYLLCDQDGYWCILILLLDPPIGTDHCDWLYGIFGHESSCTRYWTCWNGTATEQLCIGGLLYNERSHSCDWPENVEGCQKHRKNSQLLTKTLFLLKSYFF